MRKTNLPRKWSALMLLALAWNSGLSASDGTVFDLSRDFSIASNPNGVWSYGWKSTLDGLFSLLDSSTMSTSDNDVPVEVWQLAPGQIPGFMYNATTNTALANAGQSIMPPGSLLFGPGFDGWPQNFGVARFTVPPKGNGLYLLKSRVRPFLDGDRSGDTDFHITLNGTEVFGRFLGPTEGTGYTNTLALRDGDSLDFMVGRGADGRAYGSGLIIEAELRAPLTCTPHKARATAQVVNGFVVGATIIDTGCGYTNTPIVLIQGGGGTGAVAQAVVSDGRVTAIQITDAGCCYTNAPRIVISSPPMVPSVEIKVSKIKVVQNVVLGWKYVLESSNNNADWTETGPSFTAETDPIETEFPVEGVGRFFRLKVVP